MPCNECNDYKVKGWVYCGRCGTVIWKHTAFEIIVGVIGTLIGVVIPAYFAIMKGRSIIDYYFDEPWFLIFAAIGIIALYKIIQQLSTAYEISSKRGY